MSEQDAAQLKQHYELEQTRGRLAEQLLENPLLREAFEKLEQEIMQSWKTAPARDVEGREKLWTMLHLLERVQSHIRSVATTGKLAAGSLAEMHRQNRVQTAIDHFRK